MNSEIRFSLHSSFSFSLSFFVTLRNLRKKKSVPPPHYDGAGVMFSFPSVCTLTYIYVIGSPVISHHLNAAFFTKVRCAAALQAHSNALSARRFSSSYALRAAPPLLLMHSSPLCSTTARAFTLPLFIYRSKFHKRERRIVLLLRYGSPSQLSFPVCVLHYNH